MGAPKGAMADWAGLTTAESSIPRTEPTHTRTNRTPT